MAEPTPTTKTAAPTPAAQPRPPQVAVAPLDTIAAEDVAAASGEFDRWLRRISSDHVTLERLSAVVAGLPVIGNIIAFVDVLSDLVRVVDKLIKKQAVDFLDWVSLGINLIGVIPLPPAMAAARMTLRPMLHLVRQELKAGVRNIGDALVTVLVGHLNDKLAGELDTFVDVAMGKLDGLLQDCAHHCDGVADGLIDVLQRCIGDKPLFDLKPSVAEKALYDPMVQSRWGLMLGAAVRLQKRVANVVAGQVASRLPTSARATVLGAIAALGDAKLGLRNALVRLADEKAEKSIQWLLRRLLDAARRRRSTHTIVIPPNKGVTFTVDRPGTPLEAINRQVKPLGDPNPCKQCPAPGGTPHSISFATGCESLTHTDFTLAAPLPIAWQRTYRSNLGAYDQASLGARWLTPYGSRIDVVADGRRLALIHHGADGRSHRYPWLALGESHRDPVEEVSLTRIDETLLVLDVGKPLPAGEPSPWRETYELVTTCPGKVSTQGALVGVNYLVRQATTILAGSRRGVV